jgi:hypothetical protein
MFSRMQWPCSLALLALALVAPTLCPGQESTRRYFRMGFTGFPYDSSLEAGLTHPLYLR